ncbi:unnamed protein product [Moneuplotes crassus]|uniref:Glutaredoxin-like protein n=1 Tax=Euplotes crassus TaxID=5936 RepID=A0AAD1Y250_EUPCR|nr:unnamed protein product [Moneuplotes crassus]
MRKAKKVSSVAKEGEILLKLISKPCCPPCDQAHFIIKKLKNKFEFNAKRLNIQGSGYKCDYPEYSRYQELIPVILINEKEVCVSKVYEKDIVEELTRLGAKKIL